MADGPNVLPVAVDPDADLGRLDVPRRPASALGALIPTLLLEVTGPAETVEYRLLPPDDLHGMRLHLARHPGRAVLIPRRALERAVADPTARRHVRWLLRAALQALRTRGPVRETRTVAYLAALQVRTLPGPRCGCCEGPLLAEDPVVVDGASRWHLACPPAW